MLVVKSPGELWIFFPFRCDTRLSSNYHGSFLNVKIYQNFHKWVAALT